MAQLYTIPEIYSVILSHPCISNASQDKHERSMKNIWKISENKAQHIAYVYYTPRVVW